MDIEKIQILFYRKFECFVLAYSDSIYTHIVKRRSQLPHKHWNLFRVGYVGTRM